MAQDVRPQPRESMDATIKSVTRQIMDYSLVAVGALIIISAFFKPGESIRAFLNPAIAPYFDELRLVILVGLAACMLAGLRTAFSHQRERDDVLTLSLSANNPLPAWIQPVATPVLTFLARSMYTTWTLFAILFLLMPFAIIVPSFDPLYLASGLLLGALGLTGLGYLDRADRTYIRITQAGMIAFLGYGRKFRDVAPEKKADVEQLWGPLITRHDVWVKVDAAVTLVGVALVYLSFQTPQVALSKFTTNLLGAWSGFIFMNILALDINRISIRGIASLLTNQQEFNPFLSEDEDLARAHNFAMLAMTTVTFLFFLGIGLNAISQAYASSLLTLGIWLVASRFTPAAILPATALYMKMSMAGYAKANARNQKAQNKKATRRQ